jgi:hypothetical protein
MLVGTLLGDAHIRRNKDGTSFVTFEQALAKESYLVHLYKLVTAQGLSMNSPIQYNRADPRYSGKINSSLYFRTISHICFNELADLFLDGSNKVISTNIAEHLDIVALAYWICDDGQTVKRGGVTLCTDSFTAFEIQLLRDALMSNFGLSTSLHRQGKRIYIGKSGLMKLQLQLSQHVHTSH